MILVVTVTGGGASQDTCYLLIFNDRMECAVFLSMEACFLLLRHPRTRLGSCPMVILRVQLRRSRFVL